jgi:hypothetical protein
MRMTMGIAEAARRLLDWLRQGLDEPVGQTDVFGGSDLPDADSDAVEWPWRYRWDHLPKRSAGFGFSGRDYDAARTRAEEIARLTLGDDLWARVRRVGYVDLPSSRFPGVTYRLRIGRRIEVRCDPGVQPPWRQPFLCINPTYPLPEAEFFAHLYLYARDNEDELIRVAAPQPWDQPLGRTF